MLSAHMDTIEPTEGIAFAVEKDRIRSTGDTVLVPTTKAPSPDIRGSDVLQETGYHMVISKSSSLRLKKGDSTVPENLDFSGIRSGHALVLDSEGMSETSSLRTNSSEIFDNRNRKIRSRGYRARKGHKRNQVASEIITKVPDGRIDEDTTANIGIITGGTATNVVPKEVVIRGELRSHNARHSTQ